MAVFSTFILNLEKFASSHIKAEQWERKVNLGSPIELSRPSKTLPTRFPILVQVHWRQSPEEDFCASGLLRERSLEQPVRVMSGDSREAGLVGAWLCLPSPRGSSGAWVAPSERKGPGVCGLDSQVTGGTHFPPPAFLPEGISLEQGDADKGLWVGTAVSTTMTPAPILTPSHLLFWCHSRPHVLFLCSCADSTLQTPRAHSALSAFAHSLPLYWTVFSHLLWMFAPSPHWCVTLNVTSSGLLHFLCVVTLAVRHEDVALSYYRQDLLSEIIWSVVCLPLTHVNSMTSKVLSISCTTVSPAPRLGSGTY